MGSYELCTDCDARTGRAGAGEDSMFCDTHDGAGPFCEECWQTKHSGCEEPADAE